MSKFKAGQVVQVVNVDTQDISEFAQDSMFLGNVGIVVNDEYTDIDDNLVSVTFNDNALDERTNLNSKTHDAICFYTTQLKETTEDELLFSRLIEHIEFANEKETTDYLKQVTDKNLLIEFLAYATGFHMSRCKVIAHIEEVNFTDKETVMLLELLKECNNNVLDFIIAITSTVRELGGQ